MSAKKPGHPFGSIVNYALDERGRPIFVMSALAVHTKNLVGNPNASLCVFSEEAENDVLGAARMNVMGEVRRVPEDQTDVARAAYFKAHPDAEQYMEFADFAVYRMEVGDVYYVGGFGEMGWIMPGDYSAAG
jgi:heme iron utilization protein